MDTIYLQDILQLKTCKICKDKKQILFFGIKSDLSKYKDGYDIYCKVCLQISRLQLINKAPKEELHIIKDEIENKIINKSHNKKIRLYKNIIKEMAPFISEEEMLKIKKEKRNKYCRDNYNKDSQSKAYKKYYEKNKNEINKKARDRNKTEEYKNKRKNYLNANKDKIKERYNERYKLGFIKNKCTKEQKRKWQREYNRRNKYMSAIKNSVRRTRVKNNKVGIVINKDIIELLKKYNNCCFYCNEEIDNSVPEKKLNIDHFIPISKGGSHSIDNLVPSCRTCNLRKSNKDPKTFIEILIKENKYSGRTLSNKII